MVGTVIFGIVFTVIFIALGAYKKGKSVFDRSNN